jgi:hypothetical protein
MTLFNQNWASFDGVPITGRTPTNLRIHSETGQPLTPEQQGAVAHAFKLFCDAVKLSSAPDAFHVQHRILADGSRVQMNANTGIFTVDVWPNTGGPKQGVFRGFVIKPKSVGGVPFTWAPVSTLLKVVGFWKKWINNYRPDKLPVGPTYWVDTTKYTKEAVPVSEDYPYCDVYTLSKGTVYRNDIPRFTVAGGTSGVPIYFSSLADNRALFDASDSGLKHFATVSGVPTAVPLWARDTALAPHVVGYLYLAGARYTLLSQVLSYLNILVTPAGACQFYRADLVLQETSPWYTVSPTYFYQINVPGDLSGTGGYTSSTTAVPDAPWVPIADPEANVTWWQYDNSPASGFLRKIYGTRVSTSDLLGTYVYNKSPFSPDETFDIYADMSAVIQRGLTIQSKLVQGTANWYNLWDGPLGIWGTYGNLFSTFADSLSYQAHEVPPGGGVISPGATVTLAAQQVGGKLVNFDWSMSAAQITDVGEIFRTETQHDYTYVESTSYELYSNAPPATYSAGNGSGYYVPPTYYFAVIPLDNLVHITQSYRTPYTRVDRTEKYSAAGSAKDYIYYDSKNRVSVFFESILTASSSAATTTIDSVTTSDSLTMSFRLDVKVRLESPQLSAHSNTLSFRFTNLALSPRTIAPADLSFGSSNFAWKHVTPIKVFPIFTPKWFEQGLCPYLAYTTAAENEYAYSHGIPTMPRLTASFRLQALFIARSDFAPIPDLGGATQVQLPMMEQMLGQYVPIYRGIFAALESTPFILNASTPDNLLHEHIGITDPDPHSEFYRT